METSPKADRRKRSFRLSAAGLHPHQFVLALYSPVYSSTVRTYLHSTSKLPETILL